jgi:hypothetical protein
MKTQILAAAPCATPTTLPALSQERLPLIAQALNECVILNTANVGLPAGMALPLPHL